MKKYFRENLNEEFGYYYDIQTCLYEGKSPFQTIKIYDTKTFGKTLVLDNITQVTEKNERFYHEPMTHIPMLLHTTPKKILVIGGGDGGIVRETLIHNTVIHIDHIDLDQKVVEICKEYLPDISLSCWDNKKVSFKPDDGRKYIESTSNKYDIIIMDMTDPFGPSIKLYTQEYFRHVKNCFLNQFSIFCMHIESPVSRPLIHSSIYKTLKTIFKYVEVFYLYIQMYGCIWSIAVCSDQILSHKINQEYLKTMISQRFSSLDIAKLEVINENSIPAMSISYPIYKKSLDLSNTIIQDSNTNQYEEIIKKENNQYQKL